MAQKFTVHSALKEGLLPTLGASQLPVTPTPRMATPSISLCWNFHSRAYISTESESCVHVI